MIFLAVTLGFIAENLREHLNDKSREHEYVNGLMLELKQDTAELRSIVTFDSTKDKGLDTLLTFSKANLADTDNQKLLFYYDLKYAQSISFFQGSDATLQQMKNTGGLRLLSKDHIADSVIRYDVAMKDTYGERDITKNIFDDLQKLQMEIFNFVTLKDNVINKDSLGKLNNVLINADPLKLQIYMNKIFSYKAVSKYYYQVILASALHDAERMILLLSKSYGL